MVLERQMMQIRYVIGKDGKVVAFFPSKVTPDAPELKAAIEKALSGQ